MSTTFPNSAGRRILVFLKAPRPGSVKTRLAAALDDEAAAAIYRVLVARTLGVFEGSEGVELWYSPDEAEAEVRGLGRPGWRLQPQGPGDLGERLRRAVSGAFGEGAREVVVVGTDTPAMEREDLEAAWTRLADHDVVVGPAVDGGYWLLGLRKDCPGLFAGIPWSTAEVLSATLARAADLGLRVGRLRELRDVDTLEDWRAWLRTATA